MLLTQIAQSLRDFRAEYAKISEAEMASEASVTEADIRHIEAGEFDQVSMAAFFRLCETYGKLEKVAESLNPFEDIHRRNIYEQMLAISGEESESKFEWRLDK